MIKIKRTVHENNFRTRQLGDDDILTDVLSFKEHFVNESAISLTNTSNYLSKSLTWKASKLFKFINVYSINAATMRHQSEIYSKF